MNPERWNPAALVMTTTVLMKSLLKTSPATPLPPPPAWPRPSEGGWGRFGGHPKNNLRESNRLRRSSGAGGAEERC